MLAPYYPLSKKELRLIRLKNQNQNMMNKYYETIRKLNLLFINNLNRLAQQ